MTPLPPGELSAMTILSRALDLAQKHFAPLFKITALLYIPVLFVPELIVQETLDPFFKRLDGMMDGFTSKGVVPDLTFSLPSNAVISAIIVALLAGLVFLVAAPVTSAALMMAIDRYRKGKPVGIGETYRRAYQVMPSMVWATTLSGLFTGFGFFLLLLPGIYFWFAFYLVAPVVVLEGLPGMAALTRSKALMNKQWGTAFGLTLVLMILSFVANYLGGLVPTVILSTLAIVCLQGVLLVFGSAVLVIFYDSAHARERPLVAQPILDIPLSRSSK